MYTITSGEKKFTIPEININGNVFNVVINEKEINGSFIKINPFKYHLILKNISYNLDLIKVNTEDKSCVIKLNSKKISLKLQDKYDVLLHSLGLDKLIGNKVSEIKAPMPGMVLNVLIEEGATVSKGEPLIVLEAMKMENILKSPAEGVIKKIHAIKGTAVEKNQILIQFA